MSVYRPKTNGKFRSRIYYYDFVLTPAGAKHSERFYGSTGQRVRVRAQHIEAQLREDAFLTRLQNAFTLRQATERYLREKCPPLPKIDRNDPDVLTHRAKQRVQDQHRLCMNQLLVFYDPNKPITQITPDDVAHAAARRQATPLRRNGRLSQKPHYPAPATVNRQVIDPMRRLLRRARRHWNITSIDLAQFAWGGSDGLKASEPAPQNREITLEEEERLFAHLSPDYHGITRLYLMTGCRQSIWVFLPRDRVDLVNGTVSIRKLKQKRDEWIKFVLTEREHAVVTSAWERDPGAVYLFNATSRSPRDRGRRIPISIRMIYDNLKRAAQKAGLPGFRPHDLRHTYGSRAARVPGANVRSVAHSMGIHTKTATTYFSVTEQDTRNIRNSIPLASIRPHSRPTGDE